jgi:hypothetical protein
MNINHPMPSDQQKALSVVNTTKNTTNLYGNIGFSCLLNCALFVGIIMILTLWAAEDNNQGFYQSHIELLNK